MNQIVRWLLESEDESDIDWKDVTPPPPPTYGRLEIGTVIFVKNRLEIVVSKIRNPSRPPQVRLLTYKLKDGRLVSDFTRVWQRDTVKGELVGMQNDLPPLRKVLMHMLQMPRNPEVPDLDN